MDLIQLKLLKRIFIYIINNSEIALWFGDAGTVAYELPTKGWVYE